MDNSILDQLAVKNDSKIVFLILDGISGLAIPGKAGTEMQVANLPNFDRLASESVCGVMDPVFPGITPGSGPAHFALFGYDPIKFNIGRGVLSAAGVGFELTDRDLAARLNFCSVDQDGNVTDRRAGRIASEIGVRLCEKIQSEIKLPPEYEFFILPEKEYRAAMIIRGDNLHDDISDTDSQMLKVPPLEPAATVPEARSTADLIKGIISQIREILSDESPANMVLLRGFAKYKTYQTLQQRFKLRALAIANYPMYRGTARLLGMDINPVTADIPTQIEALKKNLAAYDFFFVHIKYTDARGEDGDFDGKTKVLEEVDALIPEVLAMNPEVLVVTGDHSTPSKMKTHSWHPVPVILRSDNARVDLVEKFDELSCHAGGLGRMLSVELMGLALAHANKLVKFGA